MSTAAGLVPFEVIPKRDMGHGQALREYWLPFTLGSELGEEYVGLNDLLLTDLFPGQVAYGPHFEELTVFLAALESLVATHEADSTLRYDFANDMRKAYGWDESRPFPNWSDAEYQSYVITVDRSRLLPEAFGSGGPPVPVMRGIWEPGRLSHLFRTITDRDLELVAVSLILLQYLYLPYALDPRYREQGSKLRVLARQHNAFCEQYGLPTLRWATDATLNTCT